MPSRGPFRDADINHQNLSNSPLRTPRFSRDSQDPKTLDATTLIFNANAFTKISKARSRPMSIESPITDVTDVMPVAEGMQVPLLFPGTGHGAFLTCVPRCTYMAYSTTASTMRYVRGLPLCKFHLG